MRKLFLILALACGCAGASACDLSFPPSALQPEAGHKLISGTAFWGWTHGSGVIEATLRDASGQLVPASVEMWSVPEPTLDQRNIFFHSSLRMLCLKPLRTLSAGRYAFRIAEQDREQEQWPYEIAAVSEASPKSTPRLREVSAQVESADFSVGVNPDCSPVIRRLPVVRLRYVAPGEPLLLKVRATPIAGGQDRPQRARTLMIPASRLAGRYPKTVRVAKTQSAIPAWWFDWCSPGDEAVRLEASACNWSGECGEPSAQAVPLDKVRAARASDRERAGASSALLAWEATALDLFRAQSAPGWQPLWDALAPVGTPPYGAPPDGTRRQEQWRRDVLADDAAERSKAGQIVTLQAAWLSAPRQVRVSLDLRLQSVTEDYSAAQAGAGPQARLEPAQDAATLLGILESLPREELAGGAVESFEVSARADGWVTVRARGPGFGIWFAALKPAPLAGKEQREVLKVWASLKARRDAIRAHPLVRALAQRHGEPQIEVGENNCYFTFPQLKSSLIYGSALFSQAASEPPAGPEAALKLDIYVSGPPRLLDVAPLQFEMRRWLQSWKERGVPSSATIRWPSDGRRSVSSW